MDLTAFGDSISTRTASGATADQKSWMGLFPPQTFAEAGHGAGDMSKIIQGIDADPSKKYAVMIGANDVRHYKSDTTKMGYFEDFLLSSLVWLSCPTLKKARESISAIYTGSWSDTAGNSFGKVSSENGAKVVETFEGDAVYIGYILQNSAQAASEAEVRVDGVLVGTIGCRMNVNTVGGNSYAGACKRFAGFGSGSHTVELKVISANGKNFYFDFVAGADDIDNEKIGLSNILQYSPAGYSTYGVTSATIDDYNTKISDMVSDLSGDGVSIVLVDNHAIIDPSTDLADKIHPNDAGHVKLNGSWNTALA